MNKIILAIFLSLFSISILADCNYSISLPNATYTVSDLNPTTANNFTISLVGNNYNPCKDFFFTFSKGAYSANYSRLAKRTTSAAYVNYNLYKLVNSTGVLKGPNDAVSINEVIEGTLLTHQTQTLTYYFAYTQSASSPPLAGTYVDNIRVNSYSGTYPDYRSKEVDKNLQVSITVPKLASLSLVDTGGSYDPTQNMKILDFGELTTNQELGFDIRMVSNAGYLLKVSSSNNGSMNIAGGADINSKIAYNFLINNQSINLSTSQSIPVVIASGSGVTTAGGAVVSGKAIIQSVDGKNFGIYQDYLTFTIMTTE
jgi:hypothetical protein